LVEACEAFQALVRSTGLAPFHHITLDALSILVPVPGNALEAGLLIPAGGADGSERVRVAV
jgi:hypothetical protein